MLRVPVHTVARLSMKKVVKHFCLSGALLLIQMIKLILCIYGKSKKKNND